MLPQVVDLLRKSRNTVRIVRTSPLLDYLFPRIRQVVLSVFLLEPERKWYLSNLARHLEVTPSSLQRELTSLTQIGLLRREEEGNRVYFQTQPSFPLFPELRGIFAKTTGVAEVVAETLKPFDDQIQRAFIFGSFARGEQTAQSDLDLMLVGDVQMTALSLPLRHVQNALGREVNATLYTLNEYTEQLIGGNHFLQTVERGGKLWVKGNEHDLAGFAGGAETETTHDEQART